MKTAFLTMTLSRWIASFCLIIAIYCNDSYACSATTSRIRVNFSTRVFSIPKDFIIGLDVDGKRHNQVPISLAVPADCVGLELLGPYNSKQSLELIAISLVVNNQRQPDRLAAIRARFGEEKLSNAGYSVYAGTLGRDLYVAKDPRNKPLFMFCGNDPRDLSLDTPQICDVEQDVLAPDTSIGNLAVVNVHYEILTKHLPQIENIGKKVAVFVQSLVVTDGGR